MVLFDRQIQFLDRLAGTLRAEQGRSISRAQLIRALVDSVDPDDPRGPAAGADLTRALLAKLGVARRDG